MAVQKRQPLKLSTNLFKITKLNLSDEKTGLLSNSVLSGLSRLKNGKESSATLVQMLARYYSPETQSFDFNSFTSFRFCSKEAANVLGMEDVGCDMDIEQLPEYSFPSWVIELRNLYCEERSRGRKSAVLTAAELKQILVMMGVEDEESKLNFRKLILYYLIDQFLVASTNKNPRSKLWQLVENLDSFENINWPAATLNCIYQSLGKVKSDFSDMADSKSSDQVVFGSCTPLLEAMVYERIPSLRPGIFTEEPPIIQKYMSTRKALHDWDLGNLTPSKIQACPYCGEETHVEAPSPPSADFDEAAELVGKMVLTGSEQDAGWEQDAGSDDGGCSQQVAGCEQDGRCSQQVAGCEHDGGCSQQGAVRRSSRQKSAPARLIDVISGRKGKKKK